MDSIDKLTEIFKEFPGIGERQARRFVYFLMSRTGSYNENLSTMISDLKKEVAQCKECFRFFIVKNGKSKSCEICSNPNIDSSVLMIVEKDSDLESVKKSGVYGGKYFILGGLVPIVEKTTKSRIRVEELKEKIKSEGKNSSKNNLREVILAFSLNPQGDHTDSYIRDQITDIAETQNLKISSLGKGLSTGTELEYSDNDTLKHALKNRQ